MTSIRVQRKTMDGRKGRFAASLALGAAVCCGAVLLLSVLAGCSSGGESAAKTDISYDTAVEAEYSGESTVNGMSDGLCSWTQGGQDASTLEGDDYALTPVVYIADDSYVAVKSIAGALEKIGASRMSGFAAHILKSGVNGIVIKDSTYEVDGCSVVMEDTGADGTDTCDFSGKGAAVAVYGDSSEVSISNCLLAADGVAGLAIFVDNGATVLVSNSTLSSAGGTLYEDYANSPAQALMVAPPWILGIMGTSRTTNLMGTESTMTVVDSQASASNWAVLSTDSGSNGVLNVVNSVLELTGSDKSMQEGGKFDTANPYTQRSGYGTYCIGNASETFLGATFDVGTYATIFTGGSAYYGNLTAGESYDLSAADGSVHTTYQADEDVQTVINSDTFGFMAHQDTNEIVLDGVEVNSAFTDFLVKSGCDNTITVQNGTQLNAGNGILLQLMDNDDSTTEYDSEASLFGETHEEYAGFPTEAVSDSSSNKNNMDPGQGSGGGQGGAGAGGQGGDADAGGGPGGDEGAGGQGGGQGDAGAGGQGGGQGGAAPSAGASSSSSSANVTTYNVVDCALTGSLFNGIGWNANALSDGNVKQMLLKVNLSGTSTLDGAIASTSCIHATYEGQSYLKSKGIAAFDDEEEAAAFASSYQATSFSQSEYFNIGQVANLVASNGLNLIDVTMSDDAVWTVSATSLINSLTLTGNAQVVVADGVTLTVGDKVYSAGTYTASDL